MATATKAASKRSGGEFAPRKGRMPALASRYNQSKVTKEFDMRGPLFDQLAEEAMATGETLGAVLDRRLSRDFHRYPQPTKSTRGRPPKSKPIQTQMAASA